MRRLVYILVLFVMFITSARAEIFYSTLKIGEQTTLNAYASPSSNHYISKYEWWFPSVCVTAAGGGSRLIAIVQYWQREQPSTLQVDG